MGIREAIFEDVPRIVELFINDSLGETRESDAEKDLEIYQSAFNEIQNTKGSKIFVYEEGNEVIGVMQVFVMPHINRLGSKRLQVESIHINSVFRNKGFGKEMMKYAEKYGKSEGCKLIQLTTDIKRHHAHRFYERLGYTGSHIGMKKEI